MTDRNEIFIEKYLTHFNRTKAAVEAGYSPETAYSIGAELLKKPEIKARVDERVKEIICQSDDKRAKLIKFWESVIDDEEESTHAKLKAADALGKHLAMFIERLELGGNIGLKQTTFVIENES